MSGPALPAARLGDRISHAAAGLGRDSEAWLGVALGALGAVAHTAGALSAALGASVSAARTPGTIRIATSAVVPFCIDGSVSGGSPDTFLGGRAFPAALTGLHRVGCRLHPSNPIRKGSATVFANGERLARQTDVTGCGAILADGVPTVLIGGATADAAPLDPLAAVSRGAAVAAASIGAGLGAGAGAVAIAARWGAGLATAAIHEAGGVAEEVEESAVVLEGEIAARAAELVGAVRGASLGSLIGALLGDRSKP